VDAHQGQGVAQGGDPRQRLQDLTYEQYIAPNWPQLRVENLQAGYATWGYNCNFGGVGNVRGLPADRQYFQGAWIRANIQVEPYGALYRSWLDGQSMPGDQLDVFGDPEKAKTGWCPPLQPYDFPLRRGQRRVQSAARHGDRRAREPVARWLGWAPAVGEHQPQLWTLVKSEKDQTGADVQNYTTLRWAGAAQNDFAARHAVDAHARATGQATRAPRRRARQPLGQGPRRPDGEVARLRARPGP
jgi:hypothetical protein